MFVDVVWDLWLREFKERGGFLARKNGLGGRSTVEIFMRQEIKRKFTEGIDRERSMM